MGEVIGFPRRQRTKKSGGSKPLSRALLGFLQQLEIGSHFRLIAGRPTSESYSEGSQHARVLNFEQSGFRLTEYNVAADDTARIRLKQTDLLLSISRRADFIEPADRALAFLRGDYGQYLFQQEPGWKVCIRPAVQEMKPEWVGSLPGRDVIALRSRAGTDAVAVLLAFFGEMVFGHWLSQWFEKITRAQNDRGAIAALKRVSIPRLPKRVIDTLGDWASLAQELSFYGAEQPADELLLTANNQPELDRRISKLETENYAFNQAFTAANDVDFQIRNFYPFPIAYPYRMLSLPSHPTDLLHLENAMTESMLALLASITLAISKPSSRRVVALFDRHDERGFRSGCGVWKTVAKSVAGELLSPNPDGLAGQLKALWRGRFDKNAERLVNIRNNDVHRHGSSVAIADEARKLLASCFEDFAFLIRFPIVYVLNPNVRRSGLCQHPIHIYRGDHPAHEQSTLELTTPLPESLYIFSDDGAKDLFPFISVRDCSICKKREVFFLDTRDKDKDLWSVKSFENPSHIMRAEDISEGLKAWRA
jgi:hypothetical protein